MVDGRRAGVGQLVDVREVVLGDHRTRGADGSTHRLVVDRSRRLVAGGPGRAARGPRRLRGPRPGELRRAARGRGSLVAGRVGLVGDVVHRERQRGGDRLLGPGAAGGLALVDLQVEVEFGLGGAEGREDPLGDADVAGREPAPQRVQPGVVAPEPGREARARALGALGDVDVDQPRDHVHRQHVAGVVGVDRLLEPPEQLLGAAVLADDGLPQAQRAVLDHRGEQELAPAGEQHLEALLLDDEVVLDDAELAHDLRELGAGGAQLAEALEPADRRVEAGVAQDLGEDVLDLVPRAGDGEGGEDAAADAVDADHLREGGADVAGLAEHEIGDDQVVAVIGHRRDVVEVAGLDVDPVLPLGAHTGARELDEGVVGLEREDAGGGAEAVEQLGGGAADAAVDVEGDDVARAREVADDEPREAVVPDRRDLAIDDPGDPAIAQTVGRCSGPVLTAQGTSLRWVFGAQPFGRTTRLK